MRRIAVAVLALLLGAADKRSGYEDASPAVRAMQDDDGGNPGMLSVLDGEALWTQPAGPAGRSCRSCHGAPQSLRGAAARYPAWDAEAGGVLTLEGRINRCRVAHQDAPPLPPESPELLALSALVATQSRGLPVHVEVDGPARRAFEAGRSLFTTRMGQLNLSCAQCHDGLAGQRLGGSRIPQGHPNGYPLYRLEWQALGSLNRRIRNCLTGVRAEPFPPGAPELDALALYLAWRADGLPVESPAVRP